MKGQFMKRFRHIIAIVCIVATFIANAGEQLTANAKCAANQPTAVELQLLQGTWEGVLVGDKAHQKSPSRSPAIHSIFTGTRTFGLRRQLHCLQAKTQSSYTPPSKVAHHHRVLASAKLSEPSSRLRTGH
jgi:hypothetical protein